jgi:hypothetical protein
VDDSRRSGIASIGGGHDAATRIRSDESDPRIAASAIAQAWSSVVPALGVLPLAIPSSGYRLFWSGCGESGYRDFASTAREHLIVGRHRACDIVLARDAELSLRHLLIVPASSASALRVLDLRASLPMFLDDDQPQRSLHALGPFALRVGRYVLGGFPVGPGVAAPPSVLPPPLRLDATGSSPRAPSSSEPSRSLPSAGGPYRAASRRAKNESVVTTMPRAITMIEQYGADRADAVGLLGAARRGEKVRVAIGQSDLARGVLVGRAEQCTDHGLRPLLTIRVSRVHAVVIEVDGQTMLYDCASTNGTVSGGRRIRSMALGADSPVFQLAGREGIDLRWIPLAGGGAPSR